MRNNIEKYFRITERNSSIKTEVMAGVTNYFTIIYLVLLVPEISIELFDSPDMITSLTAISFISAGLASIFMGIKMNLPFIQGSSLSISIFIIYTVCKDLGYTYYQALAIVFISGIFFFIISAFGIEKKIHKSIPKNIKYAVTVGSGFYIAVTGFKKAHIIGNNYEHINFFNLYDIFSSDTKSALLAIFGVIFITILLKKHIHAGIFIGKIVCIILAIPLGLIKTSTALSYNIDIMPFFLKLDFANLIDRSRLLSSVSRLIIIIFSICIMDIFETMSMMISMEYFVKYNKKGERITRKAPLIMKIDAVTTSIGSLLGMPTVSTYIESTTGIIEGGRTGFTAVVTGILFLLSVFISPIVSFMPSAATATTLIIAGVIMIQLIKYIDFKDIAEAVPAFLTIALMPLTNSIIIGIAVGIISYLLIHIFIGKNYKINYMMCILSAFFVLVLLSIHSV